jgi:hypothetical protein
MARASERGGRRSWIYMVRAFSPGWNYRVLKTRVNHYWKETLGASPFVTVGYTNRD